jgi:hypothetical protein
LTHVFEKQLFHGHKKGFPILLFKFLQEREKQVRKRLEKTRVTTQPSNQLASPAGWKPNPLGFLTAASPAGKKFPVLPKSFSDLDLSVKDMEDRKVRSTRIQWPGGGAVLVHQG